MPAGKEGEEAQHCLHRHQAADAAPTPAQLQETEAAALRTWRDTEAGPQVSGCLLHNSFYGILEALPH